MKSAPATAQNPAPIKVDILYDPAPITALIRSGNPTDVSAAVAALVNATAAQTIKAIWSPAWEAGCRAAVAHLAQNPQAIAGVSLDQLRSSLAGDLRGAIDLAVQAAYDRGRSAASPVINVTPAAAPAVTVPVTIENRQQSRQAMVAKPLDDGSVLMSPVDNL
jgi:hypothetical protein